MAVSLGPVKWVKHIKLSLYYGLMYIQSEFVPIISSEHGWGRQS